MTRGRWAAALDVAQTTSAGLSRAHAFAPEAARGARGAWAGLSGLHRGSASARSHARVGASVYHSDQEKEHVVAQLDKDFAAFRADVEPRATAIDAPAARAQWWRSEVEPQLSEWRAFRDRQADWIERLATEWVTYEVHRERLREMRSLARAQGLALGSPEPAALPLTRFELGAAGRGGRVDALWTIGKIALYAAVGITGVLTLRSAWRGLRGSGETSNMKAIDRSSSGEHRGGVS